MSSDVGEEITREMMRPGFYPHAVTAIELKETHISRVFLTGPFAYKIKKPVNFGFLDFSTLERRGHFCRREVTLNRRLARDIYLGVVTIRRQDGRFSLGNDGAVVEYAVKMRQLPAEHMMSRMLEKGKIGFSALDALASTLAGFYGGATAGGRIDAFGSLETIWENCEENFVQTERFAGDILEEHAFHIVRAATRSFMRRSRELFEQRRKDKKIRDCHGDLRAEHIYFIDAVSIIDCIEFNDRFRFADVASDLAFLAMDLDHQGFPQVARYLVTLYIRYSDDCRVFSILDFYKCYRAVVRVKVNCLRLQEGGLEEREREALIRETRRYLDLAYRYAVNFTRPTLWVVCGLPGTGKSTIARELAAIIYARGFSSDETRKRLFGKRPQERVEVPYGAAIYSAQASALTYGSLLLQAQDEIKKGCPAILDATYHCRRDRKECLRLARDEDANILFVECTCPEAVIKKRMAERSEVPSASDARWNIYQEMKERFTPMDELPVRTHLEISTDRPLEECLRRILTQASLLLNRTDAIHF